MGLAEPLVRFAAAFGLRCYADAEIQSESGSRVLRLPYLFVK
jgi:hypothetical protein